MVQVKPEDCKKLDRENRGRMLTVQKLIDYLKTQNLNAYILGFDVNSNAFKQILDIPNHVINTVVESKARDREYLTNNFRNCHNCEERVEKEIKEVYRYAQNDDIVIQL